MIARLWHWLWDEPPRRMHVMPRPVGPRPAPAPPPPPAYSERILLKRLRQRLHAHACPVCGIVHGGPGA